MIEILSPLLTTSIMQSPQTPEIGQLTQAPLPKTIERDMAMQNEISIIPSQIEVFAQKDQLQPKIPPAPQIPLPPEKPPIQPTSAKETKTAAKPILANQSFFTPLSNNDLLDGINGALEKMKKRKEAQVSQINDEEKKKLSTQ